MSDFLPGLITGVAFGVAVMGIYCSKRADVSEGLLKESRNRWEQHYNDEVIAHAETNCTLAMAQAENDQLHSALRTHWLEVA